MTTDLTKMTPNQLANELGLYVDGILNATSREFPRAEIKGAINAILSELTSRTSPPKGHVMLDDGRVVKAESKYWPADVDDACEDLEVILDSADDGDECEVIPLLILPREVYRVSVSADGTGTYQKLEGDDLTRSWTNSAPRSDRGRVFYRMRVHPPVR